MCVTICPMKKIIYFFGLVSVTLFLEKKSKISNKPPAQLISTPFKKIFTYPWNKQKRRQNKNNKKKYILCKRI